MPARVVDKRRDREKNRKLVAGLKLMKLVGQDRETTVVIRSITPSGFARVNGDSDGEIDLSIVSEFEECTLFKSPKRILNKENVYFNFQTTEGTMYLRVKRERGHVVVDGKGSGGQDCRFKVLLSSFGSSSYFGFQSITEPDYYLTVGGSSSGRRDSLDEGNDDLKLTWKDERIRLTRREKNSRFHLIRGINDVREFEELIEIAATNLRDKDTGETILIRAARLGYAEYVQALIRERRNPKSDDSKLYCDPSAQDFDGNTALCAAASKGWLAIVDMLYNAMKKVESGASIYLVNNEGWDARLCAAVYGHTCVVYKLNLDKNADKLKEVSDRKGNTALHLASIGGHLQTVQFLVDFVGMNIEVLNDQRWSALKCAYYYGWSTVAEFLCVRGAKVHRSGESKDRIQLLYSGQNKLNISKAATSYRKINLEEMNRKILLGKTLFRNQIHHILEVRREHKQIASEKDKVAGLSRIRNTVRSHLRHATNVRKGKEELNEMKRSVFQANQKIYFSDVDSELQEDLQSEWEEDYKRDYLIPALIGPQLEKERKHYLVLGEYMAVIHLLSTVSELILESSVIGTPNISISVKQLFFRSKDCARLDEAFHRARMLAHQQMGLRRKNNRKLDQEIATRHYRKGIEIIKDYEDLDSIRPMDVQQNLWNTLRLAANEFEAAFLTDPTMRIYNEARQPKKIVETMIQLTGIDDPFDKEMMNEWGKTRETTKVEARRPTWLQPEPTIPNAMIDITSDAYQTLYPTTRRGHRHATTIFNIPLAQWLASGGEVENECTNLYKIFFAIDEDNSGNVSLPELEIALSNESIVKQLTGHDKLSVTTNTIAHEQMEKYDLDQDGIITASEFFSGYLNKHFHIDDPLKMQLLSEWVSGIYSVFSEIDLQGKAEVKLSKLLTKPRIREEVTTFISNSFSTVEAKDKFFLRKKVVTFGEFIVGLLREKKDENSENAGKSPFTPLELKTIHGLKSVVNAMTKKWKHKRLVILFTSTLVDFDEARSLPFRHIDPVRDWRSNMLFAHFHNSSMTRSQKNVLKKQYGVSEFPSLQFYLQGERIPLVTSKPRLIAATVYAFAGMYKGLSKWMDRSDKLIARLKEEGKDIQANKHQELYSQVENLNNALIAMTAGSLRKNLLSMRKPRSNYAICRGASESTTTCEVM